MDLQGLHVESGAIVRAVDGHLGIVEDLVTHPDSGELAYLLVRYDPSGEQLAIPVDVIESIPDRREVHLGVTSSQARAYAASNATTESPIDADARQVRVPIVEEHLTASTRPVELGEVRVHKHVERIEEVVTQPITRDDLEIERVKVNRPLDAPVSPREEDDWLVVPIMEEVLVVEKRLMLTEEVRIRKRQVTEERRVRETVRRERVEIEDATLSGVDGLREAAERGLLEPARPEPDDALPATRRDAETPG
jgi:uncharacterized protein (TIGR02271 family)